MTDPIHRGVTVLVAIITVLVAAAPAGAAAPCWPPPVDSPVTDPFRAPDCRWCAGNRGIEYGTVAGAPVRAVATGRVSFAGTVAGVTYLVVRDAAGRRVTYGTLTGLRHRRGDLVVAGTVVGRAAGPFHLGLRVDDRYVDPAPFIGRLAGRPRLVPTSGAPAAPAPPPRLRCGR
jgi:murein DD-endopeptidase MepM/ murein hydrolase activator NlpD